MQRKRILLAAVFMFVALCCVILWPLATTAQLSSNSFSPATWYPSGNATTGSVATGDLNHDGYPDLVVSTQCSDPYGGPTCGHTGIFVHLNNGNGTFYLNSTYATNGDGASPWVSVAIAEMDGDGQQDLVILNAANTGANAESVSVMRGNGDGTFQAAASFPLTAGVTARKLTVADINGDGKPDVIVSDALYNAADNNYRGGVNVLINVGNGSLASPARYDSGGYASALNVITADVNHDGSPDILVSNDCSTLDLSQACTGGATIGVLLGNGNGTFQQAASYLTDGHPYPGYFLIPIAAVDLNRDGNADLLVANPHTNQWSPTLPDAATVLIGNGDGSFQPPVHYFDGAQLPVDIVAGDVDGDGLGDAVVLNGCTAGQSCGGMTGALSVMLGNGNGTLQSPALYYVWAQQDGLGMLPNTVLLADVNNDAKLDVVFATWNSVGVLLNQTTPPPTPTPTPTPTPALYNTPVGLDVFVQPVDSTTGDSAPITVTFSQVTAAGNTMVASASSNSGPALPGRFKLGNPPTYYEITSTADFIAPVTVCVQYPDSAYQHNEASLKLMHFNGIAWGNITQSIDLQTNIVCGVTSSLSPFVVAEEDVAPPSFTVPSNITTGATTSSGAAVSYDTPVATDDFDGIVPVNCSPQSGSSFALDTTQVTCSATDSAGNATQKSFNVTVTYAWSAVLQPINSDGSSIFKVGSTVPVKFQLSGECAGIQNAIARLFIAKISDGIAGNELEASSTLAATSGNQFRYDASSCQYIFNWGTKGLSSGTYQLRIDLGDGVVRVVNVSLKK
ncbi:MAG TPA: FG-GAP-like repeat-containing protein [Pyrinomonadaceae bacterium]